MPIQLPSRSCTPSRGRPCSGCWALPPSHAMVLARESIDVVRGILLLAVISLAILFVAKLPNVSRVFLAELFLSQALVTVVLRLVVRRLYGRVRARGYNASFILIVGDDRRPASSQTGSTPTPSLGPSRRVRAGPDARDTGTRAGDSRGRAPTSSFQTYGRSLSMSRHPSWGIWTTCHRSSTGSLWTRLRSVLVRSHWPSWSRSLACARTKARWSHSPRRHGHQPERRGRRRSRRDPRPVAGPRAGSGRCDGREASARHRRVGRRARPALATPRPSGRRGRRRRRSSCPLPPGAGWPERSAVQDREVPLHGPGTRRRNSRSSRPATRSGVRRSR